MSLTLANVKQFLRDRNGEDASTRFDRIAEDIANDAHKALHGAGKFEFDKRFGKVVLAGNYNTGTVSISAGGTALTGSGTTFTSAFANRYIRLNGENELYLVSAYVSPTALTLETYQGDTALSGVSYEIIMPRVAAPSRFRCMQEPGSDNLTYPNLKYKSAHEIKQLHRLQHTLGQPEYFGFENVESSSVPAKWMWVWPAPDDEEVFELPYYVWPDDMTTSNDVVEIPFEAEDTYKLFLEAYLARYQKDPNWVNHLAYAKEQAAETLGNTRSASRPRQTEAWYYGCDDDRMIQRDVVLAPGEPAYE